MHFLNFFQSMKRSGWKTISYWTRMTWNARKRIWICISKYEPPCQRVSPIAKHTVLTCTNHLRLCKYLLGLKNDSQVHPSQLYLTNLRQRFFFPFSNEPYQSQTSRPWNKVYFHFFTVATRKKSQNKSQLSRGTNSIRDQKILFCSPRMNSHPYLCPLQSHSVAISF